MGNNSSCDLRPAAASGRADQAAAERILRYETTIERQFYRAMDQLERLQRRRADEPVAPLAKLRIATESV